MKLLSTQEYIDGIKAQDRYILSRAITLVESTNQDHQKIANQIIEACLPLSGKSIRIGITGVPGVGKSTFIESIGNYIIEQDHKLAVLAIDPSSSQSKGSILGDKTRMQTLTQNPDAYIRPSPNTGSLGGVAQKTRESIILCEAAGFDVILVETVGVGQSETMVHSMVDFFLLLMLAGAGDELQGIKRGIMEMADGIAITKADGQNIQKAKMAANEYKMALHLFRENDSGVLPKVLTCSSIEKKGLDQVWQMIEDYIKTTSANGYFEQKRKRQLSYWFQESIKYQLMEAFYVKSQLTNQISLLEKQVLDYHMSPFKAANELVAQFIKEKL